MEKQTVWEILLGGNTWEQLVAYVLLGLLGAFVWLAINIDNGIKKNKRSPAEFNRKYLWKNNKLRLILTPILVYLCAIGGNTWPAVQEFFSNYPQGILFYVVIGFSVDLIISKLKAKK